jgi:hypothetical protein
VYAARALDSQKPPTRLGEEPFIKINTDNWSNGGEQANSDLGKNSRPGFMLYKEGNFKCVATPVRIRGAPKTEEEIQRTLSIWRKVYSLH